MTHCMTLMALDDDGRRDALGLTIKCSRGADSKTDATQMPQMIFFVRPMLHHERDFIGCTITAYLHANRVSSDSVADIEQ